MDTLKREESALISGVAINVHEQGVWDSKIYPIYQGVLI